MSETPCLTVFFEGRPLNLGGESSPPKFKRYGLTGVGGARHFLRKMLRNFPEVSGPWFVVRKTPCEFPAYFPQDFSAKQTRKNCSPTSFCLLLVFPRYFACAFQGSSFVDSSPPISDLPTPHLQKLLNVCLFVLSSCSPLPGSALFFFSLSLSLSLFLSFRGFFLYLFYFSFSLSLYLFLSFFLSFFLSSLFLSLFLSLFFFLYFFLLFLSFFSSLSLFSFSFSLCLLSRENRRAQYEWTTGVPDNGNDWRKFRVVPRSHP